MGVIAVAFSAHLVWLVGLPLCASAIALLLVRYLSQYAGRAGANWFIANLTAVAIFCSSYGVSLLVSEPTLRLGLEMVTFVSLCFMGPLFLGFGLGYFGRSDLIRSPLFGIAMAVPFATLVMTVTNPWHGLVWTDFQLAPVFGAATVEFTLQPWGWFALIFGLAMTSIGILLLVGTILDYGPLYRQETVAVILSIVAPSIGLFLWMFQLGPVPQLNLTAALFVPHLLFDAYAFVGTHMFETNPATQRAAKRAATADRSEPQLVVDTEAQVVNLNTRAMEVFEIQPETTLPLPLERAVGVSLPELLSRGDIAVSGGSGGVFAVSHTPLVDPRNDPVGELLVFYDITDERRRKQQLAVLNRVLRHNLRNELTVITGYAQSIAVEMDGTKTGEQAETIDTAGQRILRIAEKAREFERMQDRDLHVTAVDVNAVITDVSAEYRQSYPEATIDVTVDWSQSAFRTDQQLLSTVLSAFVENAIIHAEDGDSTVSVYVFEVGEGELGLEIRDTNAQIPALETESLRAGDETPLQHGQGIGLWIAHWSLSSLGGSVEFGYDEGNCITVRIPELE